MQDGQISSNDFHNILQEIEKYAKLKTVIRNQAKTKTRRITKKTARRIALTRKKGKQKSISRVPMSFKV